MTNQTDRFMVTLDLNDFAEGCLNCLQEALSGTYLNKRLPISRQYEVYPQIVNELLLQILDVYTPDGAIFCDLLKSLPQYSLLLEGERLEAFPGFDAEVKAMGVQLFTELAHFKLHGDHAFHLREVNIAMNLVRLEVLT